MVTSTTKKCAQFKTLFISFYLGIPCQLWILLKVDVFDEKDLVNKGDFFTYKLSCRNTFETCCLLS